MNRVGLSLHGQVFLTLSGASQSDVRAVMRATGAREQTNVRDGDVEIHFTSDETEVAWKHLGEHDASHFGDRFAAKRDNNQRTTEIELPDAGSTAPFRLIYPSGERRFDFLRSMINGKSVDHNCLGVHATAFTSADRGYMVCGWPRGGKTGTLLSYLLQGAEYLAAEWVYVTDNGRTMHGVPEPLRLRDWHLRQGANLLKRVSARDRLRLHGCTFAAATTSATARMCTVMLPKLGKSLGKLAGALDRRRYIDRLADDWLGQPLRPRSAPLDTILIVGTHESSAIQITPLETAAAKRKLIALQDEDMSDLARVYRKWSYAMSDPGDWLAEFQDKRDLLFDRLLEDKAVYAVDHPHEVKLADLFESLETTLKETCLQLH